MSELARAIKSIITVKAKPSKGPLTAVGNPDDVADAIIAALPSMIKPLVWELAPGINDKWIDSHGQGCIFELDNGNYRCGLVATYESLEDAKQHYQRRYVAKVMLDHFGVRIEP